MRIFEPVTDTFKNTSENLTKNLTEIYIKENKAIEVLNENVLELMNDKGMLDPFLPSSLFNRFKPENTSQFKLTKNPNLIRINGFLIIRRIPVTLCSNMLTFRDSINSIKMDEDLLETKTKYIFNVTHFNPQDQKLFCEFGKGMNFDIRHKR